MKYSVRQSCVAMLALVLLPIQVALAFHQDIEVYRDGLHLATRFCSRPDSGCSVASADALGLATGELPIDFASGQPIYVSQFFDLLGSIATDSPGFRAFTGDLAAGERVYYQALGVLQYWDMVRQHWQTAPDTVQIRLAGGLSLQADQQCGLVFCLPQAVAGFTLYRADGIGGAPSLMVGEALADGRLHTHLDWFLESPAQRAGGPIGAYLIEMQLFSDRHPQLSAPFFILFNHGLAEEQFQSAVKARLRPDTALAARLDSLYDWGEKTFPTLLPHHTLSFFAAGYYARCYDNGVCIGAKAGYVYATGGAFGSRITELGTLEELFAVAEHS